MASASAQSTSRSSTIFSLAFRTLSMPRWILKSLALGGPEPHRFPMWVNVSSCTPVGFACGVGLQTGLANSKRHLASRPRFRGRHCIHAQDWASQSLLRECDAADLVDTISSSTRVLRARGHEPNAPSKLHLSLCLRARGINQVCGQWMGIGIGQPHLSDKAHSTCAGSFARLR